MLPSIKDWPLLRLLFSKIPGPILAKLTGLWKLYHLLHGTYADRLGQLHFMQGPVVQVAPREYSWQFYGADRHQLLTIDKDLRKATGIIDTRALQSLRASSQMDRMYRNEELLQACNRQFLDLLANAAKDQKPADVTNLLTRYAYEVMVAMTTNHRAGFLEDSPNTKRISQQLSDWKFYSIFYGTFLRYHPYIKSLLDAFHFHSQGQSPLDPVMDVLGKEPAGHVKSGSEQRDSGRENQAFPIRDREARIALVLAGADPTIALILEVLNTVSQDQELQQQLSEELSSASSTQPPTFQSVVRNKAKAPLLHALIQRQMRSQKLTDTGLSFVAPAGGTQIGNVVVPEGETITVTSSADSVDKDDIRSLEARDPGLAPELNRHLPAYNLWRPDHRLKDCQQLLAAKLITQVLQQFKIARLEDGRMSFTSIEDGDGADTAQQTTVELTESNLQNAHLSPTSFGNEPSLGSTLAQDGLSTATDGDFEVSSSDAPLSLTDVEDLHENLGPQLTNKLFDCFHPAEGAVFSKDIIMVGPILHSAARHKLHRAIEHIYGRRLKHTTDAEEIMFIAANSTYLTNFNSKKYRGSQKNQRERTRRNGEIYPWYKDTITATGSSVNPILTTASAVSGPCARPATGPAQSSALAQPRVPTDAKWSGWTIDEHKKRAEAKTLESYKLQREQQLASASEAVARKPTMRIKEIFRQTASSSTGNSLAKPRQIIHNETTVHDADGSITISGDGVMLPKDTVETTEPAAPRKPAADFVPPHKRAALERQRLADEAATSASVTKVSSSLSPVATSFRPTTNLPAHPPDLAFNGPSQRTVAFPPQLKAVNGAYISTANPAETPSGVVAADTLGFFGFSPSGAVTPVPAASSRVANPSIGVPAATADLAGPGTDGSVLRADSPTQGVVNSAPLTSRVPILVRSRGSASLGGILKPPTPDFGADAHSD